MTYAECPLCVARGAEPWDRDCIHTCFACGFWGDLVECSGIYYCPNPLCRGCGVTNSIIRRCDKQSVHEVGNHVEIEESEVHRVQIEMVREIRDERLLAFLHERYPSFMRKLASELPLPIVDRDLGDEHQEAR